MSYLVPGPLSVSELLGAIRTKSLDTRSGNPIFSDDEIKLALREAIVNSHGKFFTSHSTTLTFTAGVNEYTVADDIDRISLITRERSGNFDGSANVLSGVNFDQDIGGYRHFNHGHGTNTLVFFRDYPDGSMNIYYERDVPVPLDDRKLGAQLSDSATTLVLTDAEPSLGRLVLPVWVKIDNEFCKVTAVASNTSATIVRAQFGSTAATHNNGTTVSFVPYADSDAFYNFLLDETSRILNQNRVQAGNQNVSVAANITAARFFQQDRDDILKNRHQPKRMGQLKFKRSRRPRRGL